jgi:formamidopyrimidine-DNA glycosylase
MKTMKATASLMTAYENRFGEGIRCRKCGRQIKKDEKMSRTMHSHRYYCQECAQNIEI